MNKRLLVVPIVGDVDEFGDVRLSMRRGSKRAEAVRVGGEAFLKANREWWLAETAVARSGYADMLADRWVEIPSAAAVSPTLDALLPETMAHCFRQATGTLSRKGMREFSGGSVIVLADEGDRPGVSPGEIHIAASGPALPLRMIQTGPRTPGEVDPRCGDADSTITASDVRLSAFNDAVRITAPRDAIDFETLLRRSAVPA